MRYFIDTEFYEDGKTIDLISIAMVAEDGRELYLANKDAQLHRASEWVWQNVIPQLPPYSEPSRWQYHSLIAHEVHEFVGDDKKPEFWAYYADYDWVVFCQLFGTMMGLPKHFPKFCMDLKQLAVMKGDVRLPKQVVGNHDALWDARWNRDMHKLLMQIESMS